MQIAKDSLTGDDIRALLEVHFAGMLANSPKDSCHFLDLSGLKAPDVTFWSVRDDDGALMGCGALREIAADHGEIKSMRTDAAHLRIGVGAAMLGHIIATGRQRGYARLSLETGSGEAFDAAHALYLRHGFAYCGPFGDYVEDPFSRYMTLEL